MRIFIHSVPKRARYTINIIKELTFQGVHIRDILGYTDTKYEGNLPAAINSYIMLEHEILDPSEMIWHLQDDVEIAPDFVERIKDLQFRHATGIICGFCSVYDKGVPPGLRKPESMWHSFPCIRIPVWLTTEFAYWTRREDLPPETKNMIAERKYDDTLFKLFMEEKYPSYPVINDPMNLVDHRDDLCGGSIVNPHREDVVRALYF